MTNTTDELLAQIDGAIEDWQVGPDAMRSGAPAGAGLASLPSLPRVDPERMREMGVRINAAFSRFAEAMAKAGTALSKIAADPQMRRAMGLPRIPDRHHPMPLTINGAEYHRRQKGRRR